MAGELHSTSHLVAQPHFGVFETCATNHNPKRNGCGDVVLHFNIVASEGLAARPGSWCRVSNTTKTYGNEGETHGPVRRW